MKILLILMLVSFQAFGSILTQDNNGNYLLKNSEFDFSKLISDYSRITKKNLIIGSDVKGKAYLYGVKKIKKEEIDLYISAVASQVGYTILSNTELNQIEVINARDIRYRSTKLYTDINNVPDNYNHIQFIMKLKYIEASDISRNFRPFMSRYGRIIDERHANTLVISDTGKNVNRLYKLAKALDTKAYVERKDFIKKINDNAKKEVTKKENIVDFIQNQHVLFLIVFGFIGGFLGFGIRGYMMKKIEGGW
jgi:general secretion pathway protein D